MYKDIRVLFIGNSHTFFNDMPHLFAEKYRECTGCHAEVTMLAYSGRTLEWHMEELFSVRFNLLYGHYDYCIIQQAAHPFPGKETTFEFAKKIMDICRTAGTQPVLYMTWAEKAHPENQQKMIDCYTELAEETGSMLAPVGLVWQKLLEDPDIDLFFSDGEHASVLGDYLISLVMCRLFISKEDLSKVSGAAIDFGIKMENNVLYFQASTECPSPNIEQPIINKLISVINQFMP